MLRFVIPVILLLGLPLAGITCSGKSIAPYLEFPPKTRYVVHTPFSVPVLLFLALVVTIVLLPFMRRAWQSARHGTSRPADRRHAPHARYVPWWGTVGLFTGAAAWVLAWTRFEWFSALQLHTFTPLWLSYILVVNALTYKRSGTCMLTGRPACFLLLFPASAAFWWFFEYLNRFVQNWYYVEAARFTPGEYVLFASLSFSTVLPAVLGTRELLTTFSFFSRTFESWAVLRPAAAKYLGLICLVLSGAGLAGIGLFPNALYPLLWTAPLIVIVALQTLAGQAHIFSPVTRGNWSTLVTAALAALVCGFFWELWNFFSLAKWMYSVPYVQRFHVFEMPLLGFSGYLPFGLECAAAGDCVARLHRALFSKPAVAEG